MRLNPPKKMTWYLSLILAVISLVSFFVVIPVLSGVSYWIMGAAWLILFLGNFIKGF